VTTPLGWEDLAARYVDWFSDETEVENLGNGWTEITTPFVDRHNDHVQVYVHADESGYLLSDDGFAFADLAESGLELTEQRTELLETILRGLDVASVDNQLIVRTDVERLGQSLHRLVQGILAVDDLYVLAQSRVRSLFYEDVRAFLTGSNLGFESRRRVQGRSGYTQTVHFWFPGVGELPQRALQAVTNPTRQVIEQEIFQIEDVRDALGDFSAFAVLNDSDNTVSEESLMALDHYNIRGVRWSQRSELVPMLLGVN